MTIPVSWSFSGPLVLLAAYYLYRAAREGRYQALSFLLVLPFAFAVEFFNIRVHGQYGYRDLGMMLGDSPGWVPFAVCLSWASMIYVVMKTTDHMGIPWHLRPWIDAVLAVAIDLVADPVVSTTREVSSVASGCPLLLDPPSGAMGLWTWCVLPGEGTWLSVPLDNYAGWWVIVLTASYGLRIGRRKLGGIEMSWVRQVGLIAGLLAVAFACSWAGIDLFLATVFDTDAAAGVTMGVLMAGPLLMLFAHRASISTDVRLDLGVLVLPVITFASSLGTWFTAPVHRDRWPLWAVMISLAAACTLALLLIPYSGRLFGRRREAP
jgi:hypothetical protein